MFGEKTTEKIKGKDLKVWKTPKYEATKKKAIEMIEGKYKGILDEGDFWILMNTYGNGAGVMYTGLIISHNGCLKLNNTLPKELQYKPSCVVKEEKGDGTILYIYSNDEQGIYEVGEASPKNCQNPYPYAMALKRLLDRVVLKNANFAENGIYSDSEAEEFSQVGQMGKEAEEEVDLQKESFLSNLITQIDMLPEGTEAEVLKHYGVKSLNDMTLDQIKMAIKLTKNSIDKQPKKKVATKEGGLPF